MLLLLLFFAEGTSFPRDLEIIIVMLLFRPAIFFSVFLSVILSGPVMIIERMTVTFYLFSPSDLPLSDSSFSLGLPSLLLPQ